MLDLLSVKKCRAKKAVPQRESTRLLNRSHFDSSAGFGLERSTGNCHKVTHTTSSRLPECSEVAERVGTRRRLPMAEALTLLSELNDELD